VLSQYVEEGYALELLQESAEGVGYLLKDRVYDLADFVASVKRVAEGGSALDPSVVSQLVGRRRREDPIGALSVRERELLELMAEGLSNSAIAARVVLTDRGVEKHVTSIFQKLELPVAADTHLRVLAVALEDTRWQLVPWQDLAIAVAGAAALRRWRPGHSRRWRRVIARCLLVAGLAVAGVALLTAFVPALPEPTGPHKVGSEIFRW